MAETGEVLVGFVYGVCQGVVACESPSPSMDWTRRVYCEGLDIDDGKVFDIGRLMAGCWS